MEGTVIDVRVFTRDGVEKDKRALQIEEAEVEQVRKDLSDQLRIYEADIYARIERLITNKVSQLAGLMDWASGSKVTKVLFG